MIGWTLLIVKKIHLSSGHLSYQEASGRLRGKAVSGLAGLQDPRHLG